MTYQQRKYEQANAQANANNSVIPPEFDNREIMRRIDRRMLRIYWRHLSDWQRVRPRIWLHDGNKITPRVTGMYIKPDGDHPGVRIMFEDCNLDDDMPRESENPAPYSTQASFTDENFNEAAAVTNILNRRDVP